MDQRYRRFDQGQDSLKKNNPGTKCPGVVTGLNWKGV
jgi:hypothetical protein